MSPLELKYLEENIKTSKEYLEYIKQKYDSNDVKDATPEEWEYYHHLKQKEQVDRFKKGKETLNDLHKIGALEQEEERKSRMANKLRGVKPPKDKIKPSDKSVFKPESYFKNRYSGLIRTMTPYEWKQFKKKMKKGGKGTKGTIKQLNAEDYLKLLQERNK